MKTKQINNDRGEAVEKVKKKTANFIKRQLPDITAEEAVAMFGYMAGYMMLHCDQRKYTSEMLIELVEKNLRKGNDDALAQYKAMTTLGGKH